MRVVPNLAQEFEEMCADYMNSPDPQGKDIVTLVHRFADKYDHLREGEDHDLFFHAWQDFLRDHKHQMTVNPMVGLVLHILITYWPQGQTLFTCLPTLEQMLVRDTVMEMHEEMLHRSADNGNAVLAVPEE